MAQKWGESPLKPMWKLIVQDREANERKELAEFLDKIGRLMSADRLRETSRSPEPMAGKLTSSSPQP